LHIFLFLPSCLPLLPFAVRTQFTGRPRLRFFSLSGRSRFSSCFTDPRLNRFFQSRTPNPVSIERASSSPVRHSSSFTTCYSLTVCLPRDEVNASSYPLPFLVPFSKFTSWLPPDSSSSYLSFLGLDPCNSYFVDLSFGGSLLDLHLAVCSDNSEIFPAFFSTPLFCVLRRAHSEKKTVRIPLSHKAPHSERLELAKFPLFCGR